MTRNERPMTTMTTTQDINESLKSECDRIHQMNEEQLLRKLKTLEEARDDPYPRDDPVGDMAISILLSNVNECLSNISKKSCQIHEL